MEIGEGTSVMTQDGACHESPLVCKEETISVEDGFIQESSSEHVDGDRHSENGETSNELSGILDVSVANQVQIYKALQAYALANILNAQQRVNVATSGGLGENADNHMSNSSHLVIAQNLLSWAMYRQLLSNVVTSHNPYLSLIGGLLTHLSTKLSKGDEMNEEDALSQESSSVRATNTDFASLLRRLTPEISIEKVPNTCESICSETKEASIISVGRGRSKCSPRKKQSKINEDGGKKKGSHQSRLQRKEGCSNKDFLYKRKSSEECTSVQTTVCDESRTFNETKMVEDVHMHENSDVQVDGLKNESGTLKTLKKFRKTNVKVPKLHIGEKTDGAIMDDAKNLHADLTFTNDIDNASSQAVITFSSTPRRKYKKREKKMDEFEEDVKKFSCSVCGKMFKLETSLTKHMWLHTGQQPYACTVCEKKFTEKSNLTTHMRIHTGEKPHVCTICGRRFTQQASLMYHTRSHTGEKPYECKVCKKTFVSSSGLNSHMISHSTYKPHKCEVCNNSFARKSGLDLHMMVHTGEKPFECKDCGKLFTQKGALTSHTKQHTGDRRYQCEVCRKAFVDNCTLKKHMRIHSGEMPYQCELCGKRFLHRTSHIEHMKVHNDERTYPCPVCGKLFRNTSSVNTHMVTHTKERPHECHECGKKFALKSNLKHHMKIHVGARDFVCEICGQAFLFKDTLREHFKTHTGEKTYNCQVCGKGYMWKPSFLRHMDEIHGLNPNDHWEVFANARGRYKGKLDTLTSDSIESVLVSTEEQSDKSDDETLGSFDVGDANDVLGCDTDNAVKCSAKKSVRNNGKDDSEKEKITEDAEKMPPQKVSNPGEIRIKEEEIDSNIFLV
ncbi:uncharacterized protein [Macrobrachium rosenbergii]|uniref:uncharacterized protein isoform X1 n=1 Tax=Macrobrachium rosenbergii TaxID=79674 RepID=UPI0034D61764